MSIFMSKCGQKYDFRKLMSEYLPKVMVLDILCLIIVDGYDTRYFISAMILDVSCLLSIVKSYDTRYCQ